MKDKFTVYTYSIYSNDDLNKYVHWSEGLTMIIEKDGIRIQLTSKEIKELVQSLPKTFGGSY